MDIEALNANKPYILSQFTEVLRNLIRASASVNNHQAVQKAVEQMQYVIRLNEKCEEEITWSEMFTHAVNDLTSYEAIGKDWQIYSAARDGMSLFTELTCDDRPSKGRISQREHNFLKMIESVLTWDKPRLNIQKTTKRDK